MRTSQIAAKRHGAEQQESKNQGIRTDQFSVGYGSHVVVQDVTLSVEPGKILTLIGPNGSGKSTILKSITRQLKSIAGIVYLDGGDMSSMKEADIAKHLSMVMTDRIKPELMTCRDVVSTGRYPYTGTLGILSPEDWAVVDESMALVRADEVADQDFSKISDGQKQRVMLARAICQDTRIMILDEPTSYLDMRFKLDILGTIRRMTREKHLAVIMSLHELDLAQKVSDVVACVDGDRIGRVGTPEEVFCGDYIQNLYGIPDACFDPVLGTMQLSGNAGQPEIFVIGGGGTGIPVYQKLQRENVPFAAGILGKNDVEYATALAAASELVSTEAFCPITEDDMMRAKQLIDQCEKCICTLDTFGAYNRENEALRDYAERVGKLEHREK